MPVPGHYKYGGNDAIDESDQEKRAESTVQQTFVVLNQPSETDAINYLKTQPDVVVYIGSSGVMIADEFRPRERYQSKSGSTNTKWVIDVSYIHQEKKERDLKIGEWEFSFDTTGRTFNRKSSLKFISDGGPKPGAGLRAVKKLKFGGAIGVSTDGDVAGVDITMPALKMTITKRFDNAVITLEFLKTLRELTGTVNDEPFLGFDPGEVLFLGATGSARLEISLNQSGSEITQSSDVAFAFELEENKAAFSVHEDLVDVTFKQGHDYLWIYFQEEEVKNEDGDVVMVLPKPVQWTIDQVYYRKDFAELQIE